METTPAYNAASRRS